MLQMIYDFFLTYFALEGVSSETQALLDLVIIAGSVVFACALLFFMYKLVKTLFLFFFRGGF